MPESKFFLRFNTLLYTFASPLKGKFSPFSFGSFARNETF
ncbi:hypothetical protein SAMN05428949_2857 [Chitinophaga sp. YR627]|uniref:Uncharacterized protein n=1 Tax=Chitinophaga pinensis (strain ATCC 43595 / DSM 2588 / LMG 13176 / NBRC 15968 / NCIMB 11800 / UQM 2034) TaxID=485918 RepID=A0A979G1U6_CHIPD|nr:hypothetical protein Cpin_1705 [Chitinophaga pinensis DSM 2588]SFN44805.1 hypothetical protein SAMN05428949_2857 [Chitinophaga sp. YR627]